MKNIKFKEVKLSWKTNIKIIIKIYYLTFKKYLSNIFKFNIFKYSISAFALGIILFSWINHNTNLASVENESTLVSINNEFISVKKLVNRIYINKNIIKNNSISLINSDLRYKSILRKIRLRQNNI